MQAVRAKVDTVKSEISTRISTQRQLVRHIQRVVQKHPDILERVSQTTDANIKAKMQVLNSVQREASKEEKIISDIYSRKSKSN